MKSFTKQFSWAATGFLEICDKTGKIGKMISFSAVQRNSKKKINKRLTYILHEHKTENYIFKTVKVLLRGCNFLLSLPLNSLMRKTFQFFNQKKCTQAPVPDRTFPNIMPLKEKCKKVQNIYKNVYLMLMHILICIRALTPVLTSKKTRIKGVKKF